MPVAKIKQQQIFGEVPNAPARKVDAPAAAFGGIRIDGLNGSMDGLTGVADRLFGLAEEGQEIRLAQLRDSFDREVQEKMNDQVFSKFGREASDSTNKADAIYNELKERYSEKAAELGRRGYDAFDQYFTRSQTAGMNSAFQHGLSEMRRVREEEEDGDLSQTEAEFGNAVSKAMNEKIYARSGMAASNSVEDAETIFNEMATGLQDKMSGKSERFLSRLGIFITRMKGNEMSRAFSHQETEVRKATMSNCKILMENALTEYANTGFESCFESLKDALTNSYVANGMIPSGENFDNEFQNLKDKAVAARVDTLIDSKDVVGARNCVDGSKDKVTDGTYRVLDSMVNKAEDTLRVNYTGKCLYDSVVSSLSSLHGTQGGRYWTDDSEAIMYEYLKFLDKASVEDQTGLTGNAARIVRSQLETFRASCKANYEADCYAISKKYFIPRTGLYDYEGLSSAFNQLERGNPLRSYVGKILAYHDKVVQESEEAINEKASKATKPEREKLMWSLVQQYESGKPIRVVSNNGNTVTLDLSNRDARYTALQYFGISDPDLLARCDSYFNGDRGCGESVACEVAAEVLNELNKVDEDEARRFSPSIVRTLDSRLVNDIIKISRLYAGSDFSKDKKDGYPKLLDATRNFIQSSAMTHIDAVFGVFNTHPALYKYCYKQIDEQDGQAIIKDDAIENMDAFYNKFLLSPDQAASMSRVLGSIMGEADPDNKAVKSVLSATPDRDSVMRILDYLKRGYTHTTAEGDEYYRTGEGVDQKVKQERDDRVDSQQSEKTLKDFEQQKSNLINRNHTDKGSIITRTINH